MRALSDALHLLSPEAEVRDRKATRRHKERPYEKELLDRALGRYAPGGDALRHGLDGAPFASINYGAGGIAYAMYRIALARGDAELLATADIWTQRAFALSSHENAFYNTALEIDLDTVGEASLFHSISGLHCVRALVSIAMGDANAAIQAIQSFLSSSHRVCPSFDLTLGKASLLLGCCELIESIPVPWFINLSPVRARGEEIAAELTALLQSQQIATSTAVTMLGIAHGWGGLAFALMRWAKATGQKPDPVVEASLDELAALAEPHGAGIRWPVHNTDKAPTYMEGWCNGAAGHALLFAMAEKTFANGRFGDPAERAAISAWTSETQFGTLCCGLGGIGYALLAIYRLTGSELWLERARSTARRAAADHSKYFLRDSLYKGTVGVALLAEEIRQPELAAMPLFEGR
jgi:serine/threonine-protein kinase